MSEVQFLWADTSSGKAQVEFSSIVQAMHQRDLVAVSRWVTRDNGDPRMGILIPRLWENIDSLSWVQVRFKVVQGLGMSLITSRYPSQMIYASIPSDH